MTTLFRLALGRRFASLLAPDERVQVWERMTDAEQQECHDLILWLDRRVYGVFKEKDPQADGKEDPARCGLWLTGKRSILIRA